jgi:hypothetical protein
MNIKAKLLYSAGVVSAAFGILFLLFVMISTLSNAIGPWEMFAATYSFRQVAPILLISGLILSAFGFWLLLIYDKKEKGVKNSMAPSET